MSRHRRASAVLALCCTVAGVGLVGCQEDPEPDAKSSAGVNSESTADALR